MSDPFSDLQDPNADPFEDMPMPEGWEPADDAPISVVVPEQADFITTTVPVYDLLMSAPCAPDPWIVWGFLWRTARHQGSNSVWATTSFIARGTHICERRVKEAKAWMVSVQLIGYRQERTASGKVGKTFTVLMPTAGSPAAQRHRCAENRRVAGCTQNALGDISSSSSCSDLELEEKGSCPGSATKPGRRRTRRPRDRTEDDKRLFGITRELILEHGPPWAAPQKENACTYSLIAWARKALPADPEGFLRAFVQTAWGLHEGTISDGSRKGREWWSHFAFIPSMLVSLAGQIAEYMRKPRESRAMQLMKKIEAEKAAKAKEGVA